MANSVFSTELQRLIPGEDYTRQQLYELFNIPEDKRGGDWATGYHRHEGVWFIFATVSAPGRTGHDYENFWAEDGSFVWRGKTGASQSHASIQSLIAPGTTVLLFTRTHDRDPFTFHGAVAPRDVKDSVPVTVVWQAHPTPRDTSPADFGNKVAINRTAFDIPYLRNIGTSEFYTKVRQVIEREMPLEVGKTIECNLQKAGGYELATETAIKPGDNFRSDRAYPDWTRFPARIRAAATALRDLRNFGFYSIRHSDGMLTITQVENDFAPTADEARLEFATKQLLARGIEGEPAGVERPTKVDVFQSAFARDPHVRAWVLNAAQGCCEACRDRAPFFTDDGLPFLEVHHPKSLSDGGSDQISNAVALCPNCHRRFHYSADRDDFITMIYQRVQRLMRQ